PLRAGGPDRGRRAAGPRGPRQRVPHHRPGGRRRARRPRLSRSGRAPGIGWGTEPTAEPRVPVATGSTSQGDAVTTQPTTFAHHLSQDPVPEEVRAAIRAEPGFGTNFTDHMVKID